jgi:hypothetical protein
VDKVSRRRRQRRLDSWQPDLTRVTRGPRKAVAALVETNLLNHPRLTCRLADQRRRPAVRRSAIWLSIGAGVCAVAAATAAPASSATAVTSTFSTPGTFSYQVPVGICQVSAIAVGASGGSAADFGLTSADKVALQARGAQATSPSTGGGVHAAQTGGTGVGGAGGSAAATLRVTPGETLVVSVGSTGTDFGDTGAGGTPDGGPGGASNTTGPSGSGGGGSSDIRQGGSDLAHRVLVGGGGGGGGIGFEIVEPVPEDGGAGGGLNGGIGTPQQPTNTFSGRGGTQIAGGAGGVEPPLFGNNGDAGAFGQGGAGASGGFFGGSGGGGGYFGGGGGGSFSPPIPEVFGDPGGGGSGFGPAGTVFQTGVNTGNGSVSITADPSNAGCVEATAAFTG